MGNFDYSVSQTPDDYVCARCHAHGVRLWCDILPTTRAVPRLACTDCAELEASTRYTAGWESPFARGEGLGIGQFEPAVPHADHADRWLEPARIPLAGWQWWHRLPVIELGDRALRGAGRAAVRAEARRLRRLAWCLQHVEYTAPHALILDDAMHALLEGGGWVRTQSPRGDQDAAWEHDGHRMHVLVPGPARRARLGGAGVDLSRLVTMLGRLLHRAPGEVLADLLPMDGPWSETPTAGE